MKKHDEDLNTTLIFVSFARYLYLGMHLPTRSQAGLFSAVTSAFILDVQSQLQPDAGEETTALLRVLIHKIDNTTFGNDAPTLPQWTGPPHELVQVQAILYASLAGSLLSAFLAMLGKQWLNRYASTDVRGTAIERSQSRQRKLDGIITWYFNQVMDSLPVILQFSLLLLGCALSRYLWEISVTVASVVLGFTSSGVVFYIFFLSAGAASESCPYQTPGSNVLSYLRPEVRRRLSSVASAFRKASRKTETVRIIETNVRCYHPWWSRGKIIPFLKDMVLEIPRALAIDIYHLGKVTVWSTTIGVYHLGSAAVSSLVSQSRGSSPALEQGVDQQPIMLDLRCISWMLQTSLDKAVHLSALQHLTTMMPLANFDPALVSDCFNAFVGCIHVSDRKAALAHGLERLAAVSAMCFLRTFHYLSVRDPTSKVLGDIHHRHNKVFQLGNDFDGLPWYHMMAKIYGLTNQRFILRHARWGSYKPSAQECISIARDVAGAAKVGYQRTQHQKVPRCILGFTLCSLSLDPLPPTSVIADCLLIIAIDLGCDVSNIGTTASENRCVLFDR